jgi:hypothetical protein
LLASTALLVSCQSTDSIDVETSLEGSALTRQLKWQQASGTEVLQCHVFKLDNLSPVEINRIKFAFGDGSHHVHIYRSTEPEADGVSDCWKGINWPRWQLVVGAQTSPLDWALPDGLTVPFEPHQQLLVQVHWLNTSPAPIDGQIGLSFFTAPGSTGHVGVMFGVNKQVDLLPGQRKTVRHFCPMPAGSQVLAMMGHFHGLGRRYSVNLRERQERDGQVVYQGEDENTLVFRSFEPRLTIPPDAGLDFSCEFLNFRSTPTTWGADTGAQEHCNLAAYYYPARDDAAFCIKEESDVGVLDSIVPASPRLRAGERTRLTIRAAARLESDTDIVLQTSDPTALQLPRAVRIAAGDSETTVETRALRPVAEVSVTAILGAGQVEAALSIGGLGISEFLTDPIPGRPGGRWVEISSSSPLPIDLGRYHLGAGRGSYDEVGIPLTGTLPPFGCLVVSETAMDALDGADATMAVPLPIPGTMHDAGGLALIDGVTGTGGTAALLDAVAYGQGSASVMVDPSGRPAAAVGAPGRGISLGRTGDGTWRAQLVPTPGICESTR